MLSNAITLLYERDLMHAALSCGRVGNHAGNRGLVLSFSVWKNEVKN